MTVNKKLLERLANNTSAMVLEEDSPVNYRTRPENIRTLGYLAPPPDTQYGIVSPLTETSRVTTEVEIWDSTEVWSVTVAVATQITMTDANGTEFVFNFAAP